MILVKRLQRYQRSKLEVKRNICQSAQFEPMHLGSAELADIFFNLQLKPLISLQPLDQNQCLVPHLKYLSNISLEIKAQGFWITFKVVNHGSKYPYLLHKTGFVDSQFGTTVFIPFSKKVNYCNWRKEVILNNWVGTTLFVSIVYTAVY